MVDLERSIYDYIHNLLFSKEKIMNTLNRRKFLSSSALLATSSLITVTANAAAKDPMPAKWDEEADIIVVGSGFAGLAAATEAKNANAGNVIVLEKMRAPGGNSVINGGIFAVPGNPAQVKLGIKDSPELLASDMIAAGLGYGYPEKIKAMTEEALPTYEWTVKELGVQYNGKVGQEGGHSVPRHVYTRIFLCRCCDQYRRSSADGCSLFRYLFQRYVGDYRVCQRSRPELLRSGVFRKTSFLKN